ncbi:MAG: protein-disulfide reductase DsbD N-terminal domain-containing protein [Cytophagaceae bacterium]|jgi:thiol:disulfide interchange protein DsbD|nr:protein-disulfide reductase DsbD N-terminal domain-containing protein [Cytophagaceae bacterium]
MKYRILLLFLLVWYQAFPQDNTSAWQVQWSKSEVKQGETLDLLIRCSIADNWYMYGSDFDPNLGPTVTTLELASHPSYKKVGNLISVHRKEKFDSLWMGKITYFTGKAEFKVTIKINSNPVIKGLLRYQVCSDLEGRCIPGFYDLQIPPLKVIPSANSIDVNQLERKNSPVTNQVNWDRVKHLESIKKTTDSSIPYLKVFISKYRTK